MFKKKTCGHFLIKTGLELALPGYDVAGEAPSHLLGWCLLSYIIDDVISTQITSLLAFFWLFSWFSYRIEFCKHSNFLSVYVTYMLLYTIGKVFLSSI